MITSRRSAPRAGGVLLLAALAAACDPPLENPIKIGVVLALTGPNSAAGANQLDAAVLAAEQINAQGGVLGRPLVLVLRDDKSTPETGAAVAMDLVANEGVEVLLGSNPGGSTLKIAQEVTIPNQVVHISGASTHPDLSYLGPDSYFFRTVPSDIFQMRLLARRAREKGYTKVAQIYSPTLDTTAQAFAASFTSQGGEITSSIQIVEGRDTYADVLADTFATAPEALQISCRLVDTAQIVRDYVLGFPTEGVFFLFSNQHAQSDFVTVAGANNFTFGHEGTRPTVSPANARFSSFADAFRRKYGVNPESYGQANTYDALMVLALAISAAGEVDGPAVREQMRAVSVSGSEYGPDQFSAAASAASQEFDINYQGVSSDVDFDENGDVLTGYDIWRVSGGKVTSIQENVTP